MKILGIIGVPGSGKSTLMSQIVLELTGIDKPRHNRYGLLNYLGFPFAAILGIYDGSIFQGTDRLSSASQPDAEKFVTEQLNSFNPLNIGFEGDRFGNGSFLNFCRSSGCDLRLICLSTSAESLSERRKLRSQAIGKAQDPIWLKGRQTKVSNLVKDFNPEVIEINNFEDSRELAKELADWLTDTEDIRL